jgi:hypothetical protein
VASPEKRETSALQREETLHRPFSLVRVDVTAEAGKAARVRRSRRAIVR